jgi:hypothetical protein
MPGEPVQATSAPGAHDLRWVFLGPNGLRAGWGILLFIAIWLLLTLAAQWVLIPALHWRQGTPMPPRVGILFELANIIPALIATWILAKIEGRPLMAYGFQGKARATRFLSGLVWGFVAISALVLTLWKLGNAALGPGSMPASQALADAAMWGAAFLLTGFFEESLFRGYVQFTLTRGIGFWWGALLVASAFGLTHTMNEGESLVGLASVVGVGLVFCLSLWYTGSLWWAVGFHAAWDWGQSYFYGTADSGMVAQGHLLQEHPVGSVLGSGGATGPEGSVLILPLLLMVTIAMVLWWGRRAPSPFIGAAWKPKRRRDPQVPLEMPGSTEREPGEHTAV